MFLLLQRSGGKFYFEGLNLKSKHLIKKTKDFICRSSGAKTNTKQKKKKAHGYFPTWVMFFLKEETLVTEKLANTIMLFGQKLEFWHAEITERDKYGFEYMVKDKISPQLYLEANRNSVVVPYIWTFILNICIILQCINYQVSKENKLKYDSKWCTMISIFSKSGIKFYEKNGSSFTGVFSIWHQLPPFLSVKEILFL